MPRTASIQKAPVRSRKLSGSPQIGELEPLIPRQISEGDVPLRGDRPEPKGLESVEAEGGTYAATLILALKDLQRISSGTQYGTIRASRVILAFMLLYCNIGMQIFLLCQIKQFVTSPYVLKMRNYYDKYERTMYNGHVTDTGYGFALGVGGKEGPFYDASKFDTFDDDFKDNICTVPFSQFPFIFTILFIWTLAVVGELKVCLRHALWLYETPPVSHLYKSMEIKEGEDGESTEVITGTTSWFKLVIMMLIVLPRLIVAFILLWLGCRWLLATMDFDDLLVNATALVFIIQLNSLLYDKLMSDRNKREVENAKLDAARGDDRPEVPGISSMIAPFGWGIAAAVFCYAYIMHFQMILPGYRFDIKEPCAPFVNEKYNFWRK